MNALEQQIYEVLDDVWSSMLGLGMQPRAVDASYQTDTLFTTAYVGVQGAWRGEVLLACDAELARYVAAQFYEIKPALVTDAEIRETLYELGGIVAGNLKRLLPEPSSLSVPLVGYGGNLRVRLRLPNQPAATRVLADYYGRPLVVVLTRHW